MNKKLAVINLSAELHPGVSLEDILLAIKPFTTSVADMGSGEAVLLPRPENTEVTWLYASCDEDEGFVVVSNQGGREGEEISKEALADLRLRGVCTAVYGEYPDASKYGSPMYTVDDRYGMLEAANFGFAVWDSNLFASYGEDTQDDSAGALWLKIETPKSGVTAIANYPCGSMGEPV